MFFTDNGDNNVVLHRPQNFNTSQACKCCHFKRRLCYYAYALHNYVQLKIKENILTLTRLLALLLALQNKQLFSTEQLFLCFLLKPFYQL